MPSQVPSVSPLMKRHHRNHFYTSEFAKMVDWEGKFGLIMPPLPQSRGALNSYLHTSDVCVSFLTGVGSRVRYRGGGGVLRRGGSRRGRCPRSRRACYEVSIFRICKAGE